MPQIPMIRREGSAAVAKIAPARPGDYAPVGLAATAGEFDRTFSHVRRQLQAQQDEMDLARMVGEFDAGVAQIQVNLSTDTDYANHGPKFLQAAEKLQSTIAKQPVTDSVAAAFTAYTSRHLPLKSVAVQARGLELWNQKQRADLDDLGQKQAVLAAEAVNDDDRQLATRLYLDTLGRMEQRGIIAPEQAMNARQQFERNVLVGHMDFLRRTAPEALWEKERRGDFSALPFDVRARVFERLRKDQEHQEAIKTREFNKVKSAVERVYTAEAIAGNLADADLRDILANKNPYLTPKEGLELQRLRDNPLTKEKDLAVQALRQEYLLGDSSLDRIRAFRTRLKALASGSEAISEDGLKFADELQTDERTMQGITAQQTNQKVQQAVDDLKANQKPSTGIPFIDKRSDAEQKIEQARVRNQVRRGADPAKAAADSINRTTKKPPALPKETEDKLRIIEEGGR